MPDLQPCLSPNQQEPETNLLSVAVWLQPNHHWISPMLLDLGLQTEGKFQKVLEACQYPEKSKGQASQQERGPVEKMERHLFQAPKRNHGPKFPDWQGDEIQGPSGFWALMGKEVNCLGKVSPRRGDI